MVKTSMLPILLAVSFLSGLAPVGAAEQTQKGVELYRAHKYKDAATELKRVLGANPSDPGAHYYLGLTLLELKDYQQAEAEFKEAEKILSESEEPRPDQVKVGLARAYMEQKEYDKAQASLDEAREIKQDNPEVYLYFGKLELHREDYTAAAEQLDKAIELDPKNAYAHYYAGIAYSNIRRPDKMVDHFQMFLKLAPDAPEAKKVRSLLRSVR